MQLIAYVVMAWLVLLVLSGFSDSKWGSGVRGALSGVSRARGEGVRDRLSAGVSGARQGWSDTPRGGHRPVGRTPPPDTLLSRLTGRVSGAVRGAREEASAVQTGGVRGHLWAIWQGAKSGVRAAHQPRVSDTRTPMILVRPDGTATEFAWDEATPLPRLRPGEHIHWLDEFGSFGDDTVGSPITYDDQQQPGGIDHSEPAEELTNEGDMMDGTAQWDPESRARLDEHRRNRETAAGQAEAMESFSRGGQQPAERVPGVSSEERVRQIDYDRGPVFNREQNPSRNGGGVPAWATNAANGHGLEAIESLPQYRRYLAAAKTRALSEQEDADALAQRLTQQAQAIADAVDRFAAMHGDPATVREGHMVAEAARLAREAAVRASTLLTHLAEQIQVTLDGLRRHDQVQESHDAGVHMDRDAYAGS